ncbi:MAG: FMN-binding glutamate synthase family protein [Rhodoblastus sp.]
MDFLRLAFARRYLPLTLSILGAPFFLAFAMVAPIFGGMFKLLALICACLAILGLRDLSQTRHAILRSHPISGHLRFLLEEARPELRQYFFEDDKNGAPFSRDNRTLVYQRAKDDLDKRPFGTELDVYAQGYEFVRHSIAPTQASKEPHRIIVGAESAHPYSASILNISAMSFGALSANAIRALNAGARRGGFAHDTGEGGVSAYHREAGGDLIWEIGSGYFGCRDDDGRFSPELFARTASDPQIKMVELKLSQGAKPGHGGVLPAAKLTPEIAGIRGVPLGRDCVSPACHSAFSTPLGLVQFIDEMRRLSGGKPAGFKLCIGQPIEFLAICKAMIETGLHPDFIVIDGKEGGTGAAPLEFMDHLGMPMREGLSFVHNALVGAGLREKIRIGAAGKIISAFDIARAMALGADWCNAARGFMFALGCIQSQSCHNDRCPTGVATQDPHRSRALVVPDKAERVYRFHRSTLTTLAELTAAAGLDHPNEFTVNHFMRRVSPREIVGFEHLYPALSPGELVTGATDQRFGEAWRRARADSFAPA